MMTSHSINKSKDLLVTRADFWGLEVLRTESSYPIRVVRWLNLA